MTEQFIDRCLTVGLTINHSKCKFISLNFYPENLVLNGIPLKRQGEVVYLGHKINPNGQEPEIRRRYRVPVFVRLEEINYYQTIHGSQSEHEIKKKIGRNCSCQF